MRYYTPAQAAKILQIASSSIRNYTRDERFRAHFSPTATPTAGTGRQLTANDLRLLRFIADATAAGQTLQTVAERLQAGELDAFTWSPPGAEHEPEAGEAEQPAALVLAVQSMAAQLDEYQHTQAELNAALIESARALARAESRLQTQAEEIERLTALLSDREELERLRRQLAEKPAGGLLARLFGRKS